MGLQVWLPLNGNLENKGLGEIDNVQGTPSYRTNGKIGSALELNQRISFSCHNLKNLSTFTICFWICIDDSTTLAENWVDVIGFADISTTGTSGTFRCETSYGSSEWKGAHWHDNPTYALIGNTISGTTNHIRNNNIWQHCAVVCDNEASIISFYTDGELTGEFVHKGGAFNNTGTFYLGQTDKIMGAINDVRFYDNALSPFQVKQISQGLVAHYLLDNNGSGNNNLGLNSYNLDISEAVDINFFSKRRNADIIQLREDGFTEIKSYGSSYGGIGIYANLLNLQIDAKITFSFYAYTNGSLKNIHFFPMIYNSSGTRDTSSKLPISVDGGNYTEANAKMIDEINNIIPKRHFVTFKWNNTMKNILDNGGKIELTIQFGGTWQNGDYGCIFAPKLEYGDKPTSWCPNSEDVLATQLGYNSNIEYDVSGYCHNGTKYNITDYTSDTPRYSIATKFNGTNSYINIGRGGKVKDAITVSSWVYMNDWSTYSNPFISCTQTGGWNFSKNGSNLRFLLGTGTTSNTNKNAQVLLSSLTSGWHMITATYDGLVVSLYIDGILTHGNTIYSTKTPIYYNATNDIIIGAEAGSGATPTGEYFNGRISDVRIYATALSDTDILALYKNSAYIDSSGNVFASEYQEE